jgi:glutaredoxin 3
MTEIVIYSKENCPYCDMAKNWFKSRKFSFTENKIGTNGFTREMLLEAVPTARTVPQIIIDGKLIGGWDDLRKTAFYAEHSPK